MITTLCLGMLGIVQGALRYADGPMMEDHHEEAKGMAYSNITVHVIPHSHDDVGWLKTLDQYFYGSRNDIQLAGVQYVLDSVVQYLSANPNYTFSMVEIAFVKRWWDEASDLQKQQLRQLVANKQVEFINAGWCMSDEANAYYEDIIDQMTVGLTWVNETFGVQPTIGWHVDPFGHQSAQATLFSKMGFNAWFFARIDYQDKQQRLESKRMETIMRPAGTQEQIFSHVQYHHYSAPPGYNFDIKFNDEPIMDDPRLEGYNLDEKAAKLVEYFQSQALHYRSSNLIHTFGQDFTYITAGTWYKNIDKLMARINSDPSFNTTLVYSTPGRYIQSIFEEGHSYPLKFDDFFPYADVEYGYWSGYYTSRTALKLMVRDYGRWMQSVRTFTAFAAIKQSPYFTANRQKVLADLEAVEQALGVLQHHDAVSGTAKQAVTDDYYFIGSQGKSTFEKHYFNLQKEQAEREIGESASFFSCNWNATKSECNLFNLLQTNTNVLVQVYNPGSARLLPIRMLVPAHQLSIKSNGVSLQGDIICDNENVSDACTLVVMVELKQPNTYLKIAKASSDSGRVIPRKSFSIVDNAKTWSLGEHRSISFQKKSMSFNFSWAAGHYNTFTLTHQYYQSYQGEGQKSGAYIFRPSNRTYWYPIQYSKPTTISYFEGKDTLAIRLAGERVSTTLWFYHRSTFYGGVVELTTFVAPIPLNEQGKEVVMRIYTPQISNNDTFYTDSSGMHMQKRRLNIMPQYNLTVHEPIAGNYYPVNSLLTIVDQNDPSKKASLLTDRSQGGISPKNGTLELMIQRRLRLDDSRGVGEPLEEKNVSTGEGISQLLRHSLIFDGTERAQQKSRDQWPILSFATTPSLTFNRYQCQSQPFSVPQSVKLYLKPLKEEGSYIMRVHNTKDVGDELLDIEGVEMTLAGNQGRAEWDSKRLRFKAEEGDIKKSSGKRLTEQEEDSLTLKAGDIRTFLIKR